MRPWQSQPRERARVVVGYSNGRAESGILVRRGRLRIRLLDPSGVAFEQIRVSLRDEATGRFAEDLRMARPDAEGVLHDVPPGRYRVETHPEQTSLVDPGAMLLPAKGCASIEVRPGRETPLTLHAERGGRLRVLLPANGQGNQHARLAWAPGEAGVLRPLRILRPTPGGWSVSAELPPGVQCTIYDLLPAGPVFLRAWRSSSAPCTVAATVEPGRVRDILFERPGG